MNRFSEAADAFDDKTRQWSEAYLPRSEKAVYNRNRAKRALGIFVATILATGAAVGVGESLIKAAEQTAQNQSVIDDPANHPVFHEQNPIPNPNLDRTTQLPDIDILSPENN